MRVVREDAQAKTSSALLRRQARILRLPRDLGPGAAGLPARHAGAPGVPRPHQPADRQHRRPAPAKARSLARIGLANYFAGALILPMPPSLRPPKTCATTSTCSGEFGVGFETICHRASTLQRLARAASPSSSSASIAPAIFPSASRRRIFISRAAAAPAPCGTSTRPLRSRAGSDARRVRAAGPICRSPGQSSGSHATGGYGARRGDLRGRGSAAISGTPAGWSIRPGCGWTTPMPGPHRHGIQDLRQPPPVAARSAPFRRWQGCSRSAGRRSSLAPYSSS